MYKVEAGVPWFHVYPRLVFLLFAESYCMLLKLKRGYIGAVFCEKRVETKMIFSLVNGGESITPTTPLLITSNSCRFCTQLKDVVLKSSSMVIRMYSFLESNGVGGGTVLDISNKWFTQLFESVGCNPLSGCQQRILVHQPQQINNSGEILLWRVAIESGNWWDMVVIITLVYVRLHLSYDIQVFAWVLRDKGNCSGVGFGERIVRIKKMHTNMKSCELLGMGSWQVDAGGEWREQGSILKTQWEVIKFISGPQGWNKLSSVQALIDCDQHHNLWKILIFESSIPIQSEVLYWILDFSVHVCITRIDMHKLNVFIALILQMGLAKDVCHATTSSGEFHSLCTQRSTEIRLNSRSSVHFYQVEFPEATGVF